MKYEGDFCSSIGYVSNVLSEPSSMVTDRISENLISNGEDEEGLGTFLRVFCLSVEVFDAEEEETLAWKVLKRDIKIGELLDDR